MNSIENLPPTPQGILLRYHEIALKGGNRRKFETRLAVNIEKMLKQTQPDGAPIQVRRQHDRLTVVTDWNAATQEALTRVFGLANFSPMRKVLTEKSSILQAIFEEIHLYVARHGHPKSFKVKTRRSDKALPESSVELDAQIGSEIQKRYPHWAVNLKSPEFTLGLEIRFQESFIWTEKFRAQGGLPVGTNGKVLTLISGGIDSPVAAIYALRRGSPSAFVHFYGAPFVGDEVLTKIESLVRLVNRFHPNPEPLHVIPFGKIQEKIAMATEAKMRTILYRRMMVRIAGGLAKKLRIEALVTGESLGQVASQTLENLTTIQAASPLPILRPLITFNKDEIIEKAKSWGTYETSIRPGLDCCTLFSDRHPILRSTLEHVEKQETRFSVPDLLEEALAGAYSIKI